MLVSVDPERDTPETLTRYLAPFEGAIMGVSGEDATLRVMADEFGAFFEPVSAGDSPLYTVDHTASQFLIDDEGNFITVYSFGTPVDVIIEDLQSRRGGELSLFIVKSSARSGAFEFRAETVSGYP